MEKNEIEAATAKSIAELDATLARFASEGSLDDILASSSGVDELNALLAELARKQGIKEDF